MNGRSSLPAGYFEALYAADDDPWCFATSRYEQEKYAASLQALPTVHFASAFEVGCSIGVLTRMLAKRCTTLLAVDVVGAALAQARQRCADLRHVVFERATISDEWPQQNSTSSCSRKCSTISRPPM